MTVVDIISEVTGTVWKVQTHIGQQLAPDDAVLLIESMKMEIPVCTTEGGTLLEILVAETEMVLEGAVVARLQVD